MMEEELYHSLYEQNGEGTLSESEESKHERPQKRLMISAIQTINATKTQVLSTGSVFVTS